MPEDPTQPAAQPTTGGQYICNVQAWGSSPTYTQGQPIPADCPYDVEAAHAQGKVLTPAEYKEAHPDWDPEAAKEAARQQAEFAKAFPGRDLPTAAAPPDPKAEKQLYDEAAAEAAPATPKPTQVQPATTDAEGAAPKPTQVQQPSSRSSSSTPS